MPIGGGIFKPGSYDKIIPGIYANFTNIMENRLDPFSGYVSILLPVVGKTKLPPVTQVTYSTYRTKILDFVSEDTGGVPVATLTLICREILCNARYINLIPIAATNSSGEISYTTSIKDLESKLNTYPLNVILYLDFNEDGFIDTFPTGDPEKDEGFFATIHHMIAESCTRFVVVRYVGVEKTPEEAYKDIYKWIVIPYHKDTSYFLAGALASLEPGESASGMLYTGELTTMDSNIPLSIEDQETALNTGKLSFYKHGNEYRILKDITSVHTDTSYSNLPHSDIYNERMGQIVRLEAYVYEMMENLYSIYMQGKPNSSSYRDLIHSLIYAKFVELEEDGAIENCNPEDISVDPIKEEPNKIRITGRYKPVSGIDYVYIEFEVN